VSLGCSVEGEVLSARRWAVRVQGRFGVEDEGRFGVEDEGRFGFWDLWCGVLVGNDCDTRTRC
jgi:hypothetical protein